MFSVGQLQFIDSLQFMNSSLDKLLANLQTENLAITRRGLTDKELALLRRKGVYPYEYVDNIERFDETQHVADIFTDQIHVFLTALNQNLIALLFIY